VAIHRLAIPVTDYQEIVVSGRVLSVHPDRGGYSDLFDLWFEADGEPQKVGLYIFGTGHPTPWSHWTRTAYQYIGTVVNDYLVWHVYTGPLAGEAIPA
jgi:hypothetical protein